MPLNCCMPRSWMRFGLPAEYPVHNLCTINPLQCGNAWTLGSNGVRKLRFLPTIKVQLFAVAN